MKVPITKSGRKFGYIIWSRKNNAEFEQMLGGLEAIDIYLNGFFLGKKKIDWKYYRISMGYKFTRALPPEVKNYILNFENNELKVECE